MSRPGRPTGWNSPRGGSLRPTSMPRPRLPRRHRRRSRLPPRPARVRRRERPSLVASPSGPLPRNGRRTSQAGHSRISRDSRPQPIAAQSAEAMWAASSRDVVAKAGTERPVMRELRAASVGNSALLPSLRLAARLRTQAFDATRASRRAARADDGDRGVTTRREHRIRRPDTGDSPGNGCLRPPCRADRVAGWPDERSQPDAGVGRRPTRDTWYRPVDLGERGIRARPRRGRIRFDRGIRGSRALRARNPRRPGRAVCVQPLPAR